MTKQVDYVTVSDIIPCLGRYFTRVTSTVLCLYLVTVVNVNVNHQFI